VIDFLAENKELPVIQKIVNMEKLSSADISELEKICWKELGTKEDYEKFIAKSNMICGDSVGAFIRSQIGVDRHIAMQRFSQFLSDTTLNSLQEEYIKSIITYVCDNGDITPNTLMEEEPFAQYEWIDTFGKNFVAVRNYVNELHSIVRVANGESINSDISRPAITVSTQSKRDKKADEVRFIASGSVLTNILDDNDVRKLIHNMMEMEDGTTIETIYLECMREYQEKYFSMKPNEWRHLVRDYVRAVTERPDLEETELFTYKSAI
jgi:type I restriction enzyme R subunit